MELEEIFAKRLKMARRMRGLSLDELSDRLGGSVSKQSLSNYELGRNMPHNETILAICKALGVKYDYMFRELTPIIDSDIHFRKLKKMKQKEVEAVRLLVEDSVERMLEVDDILGKEATFDIPFQVRSVASQEDARQCAIEMRNVWNIGVDPISGVYDMLENHGAVIVEVDAPASFSGLNARASGGIPVIVIRKDLPTEVKRFTAFHELGHYIMDTSAVGIREEEQLCDAFAREMLIPSSAFKNEIGERRHDIAMVELANLRRRYGISVDSLMQKAHDLGIISDRRFKTYFVKKKSIASVREEADRSVTADELSLQMESKVFRALSCDMITESKAAELLNWSVSEVHSKFTVA